MAHAVGFFFLCHRSVFKTLIVPRSSIVLNAFVHKPMARRTQGNQVQLRIVTGVTAKFSVMNLRSAGHPRRGCHILAEASSFCGRAGNGLILGCLLFLAFERS
jgi:hypothetical protein